VTGKRPAYPDRRAPAAHGARIEVAAGAILDVPGALARWPKRDEVQQLFTEIDKRFGGRARDRDRPDPRERARGERPLEHPLQDSPQTMRVTSADEMQRGAHRRGEIVEPIEAPGTIATDAPSAGLRAVAAFIPPLGPVPPSSRQRRL